ncbi:MAG: zinc-ribbon domain-containing protein [Gammaproteobacteria bacterium]|nr:zinc-ribbon domain-containing protein [Gammaproteobacteria bacterium]
MTKRRKATFKTYVSHPRYGDKPLPSNNRYTLSEIQASYWQYEDETIFPETAIPADISKQNYSVFPRKIYVDMEKQCADCKRPFIFYAQEQKYWYEILGFFIDADCIKCVECRKQEREVNRLMQNYEKLLKTEHRTADESKTLKAIALELFQLGYIRDRQKVDRID